LERAAEQKQELPARPENREVAQSAVQRSTVIRAEVSARLKPGKPAGLGGAAQPSYFHPTTEAGRALALGLALLVLDGTAEVELLVN